MSDKNAQNGSLHWIDSFRLRLEALEAAVLALSETSADCKHPGGGCPHWGDCIARLADSIADRMA